MTATRNPTDYRALMEKVEQLIDHIEHDSGETLNIQEIANRIICKLRGQIGITGGRLYELDDDSYLLRAIFPDAKPPDREIRVPRTYPPLELCLMRGSVYMTADDPMVDRELEASLGVKEFAAVELGNERYVLGFDVVPSQDRNEVLFSLGVIRHSINRRIRSEQTAEIFREARRIQTSILPRKAPRFPGFDIAGHSRSLDSVGGDLFDFIPIHDKILGLAIADASGHGLPAALQVRDIYTGLRMGLERDFKIVRTVERLNRIINASTLTSRFVSLFYGELETSGNFISVNAGHPPPFHLAASGRVTYLEQGGPVLGPLSDATYDRSFVAVQPGDMLVLYTDGITETLNAKPSANGEEPEEFGVERLLQVARSCQGCSAADIVEAVFEKLQQWSGDAPARDDCTVIVVVRPR